MRTRNAETPKSGPGRKAAQAKKEAAVAEKSPDLSLKTTPKSTSKSSGAKVARGKQSVLKPAATASITDVTTPELKPDTEAKEAGTPVLEDVEKLPEKKPRGKAKSPIIGKVVDSSTPKIEESSDGSALIKNLEENKEDQKVGELQLDTESTPHNEQPKVGATSEEKIEEEPILEDSRKDPDIEWQDNKMDADCNLDAKQDDRVELVRVTAEKDENETIPKLNDEFESNTSAKDEFDIGQDLKDESTLGNNKDALAEQKMEEGEPECFAEAVDEDITANVEEEGEEGAEEGLGEDDDGPKLEEEEQIQISDMAKARKIKKEQEIFVGGLDRDAVEDDLKKAFEKVGEVVEVRLHRDYATNKNKGFAFVKFAKKEEAARALEEMKNPVIRGKRCGIAPSEDNDTLFLGNICNTWTKDAVKRKLKDYGIDAVENITLVADTQNEGLSRGFAFIEFSCHPDAMAAYKRLQKPDVVFGHPERTAKVAFAEPLREPDPEVMSQVKSVFIDGLPPYWDEDHVKEQYKCYGEIERVVLARNMSTAKRKDFGFVNFTNHEAAVACVVGINNIELGNGKSKIKTRARLANPLPKTQAVKGGMSGGFRIGHTGRGFGRGRFPFNRAGFPGGRGFFPRARGRAGRFNYAIDEMEFPYPEFRGWRPYGARGGRRGSATGRLGAFDRGRGRGFPSRRPPFPQEGNFGGRFGTPNFGEDPYFYGDGGHGLKRPYSMIENDPGYLESSSRLRPRYDLPDPLPGAGRYRDPLGMSTLYSRDYYGSEYAAGSSYSSFYGGESSGRGYYY
ncbi:hypothetical protein HPP92_022206 [Vanilla planifolia]|uniref:RRM domain-containing protein n=1 Tax=Vanilla planifolia TaxID=51239 RepID=A0A835PXS7_VANPL|nr:hypothetical protein HPP92_022206 [Vanilla planifolia]